MNSLVSIVIPTYNYGRYISESIKSLLDQSYTNIEIMVIDDGSMDNTEEVVKSFSDSRIRYFYQKNQGANVARNRGIKEGYGSFLIFLDADDVLGNTHIEEYIKTAIANPEANIYGPSVKGTFGNGSFQAIYSKGECPGDDLLEHWIGDWWISSLCILWPKQNVLKVGGWDESLYANQDGDIAMRALIEEVSFIFCAKAPVAKIRSHKNELKSISGTKSLKSLESRYRVLEKIEKLLKEKKLFHKKYRKVLANKYFLFAKICLCDFPEFSDKCFRKFKRLNGFSKPPGSFMNWFFLYLLGIEKKEKLAEFIGEKKFWSF